jgi:MSHA biogenesis protein MshI
MVQGLLNKLTFWKNGETDLSLGVFVTTSHVYVFRNAEGTLTEDSQVFAIDNANWVKVFAAVLAHFGPAKLQLILASNFYQLVVADKPNIEESELTQALLWSVKDMVSEPVTNIHLDYFEAMTVPGKVNVAVVSKAFLGELAQACDENSMQIAGISIEELALSNFNVKDHMARLIMMHLPGQELLLTVVKEGELLMQRRVRGFAKLHLAQKMELSASVADNLSLEIQRSMDYFESQLRQAPVASIEVVMDGEGQQLAQLLAANFNQKVTELTHAGVAALMAKFAHIELTRGQH